MSFPVRVHLEGGEVWATQLEAFDSGTVGDTLNVSYMGGSWTPLTESRTYRVASTPGVCSPGVFRWVLQMVRDGEITNAVEILKSLSIPDPLVQLIVDQEGGWSWEEGDHEVLILHQHRRIEG